MGDDLPGPGPGWWMDDERRWHAPEGHAATSRPKTSLDLRRQRRAGRLPWWRSWWSGLVVGVVGAYFLTVSALEPLRDGGAGVSSISDVQEASLVEACIAASTASHGCAGWVALIVDQMEDSGCSYLEVAEAISYGLTPASERPDEGSVTACLDD